MNLMMTSQAAAWESATSAPADDLCYGTSACVFGEVLAARSAKGVCAVLIGDTAEELRADLARRFPQSTILANASAVRDDLAQLVRFMKNPAGRLTLTLDMRGTPFQRRVWEALQTIPPGKTVTYKELARQVSPASSPRAVGSACAANPVALAIPCHRVVRGNGDLAGYRWGIERKRALIQREAMA